MPSSTTPPTVLLVALVLAAGCLGGPGGTPTADPASPTPTASPTATTPTPTASPDPASPATSGTPAGTQYAADRPEPSHEVTLTNAWNRSVAVSVTVVREATGGTVHEGTYDLAAGAERTVYDTAEADPDGVETFTVTATALNATGSVTIETSRCYGDVHVEVTEEGELYPYYAVC